MVRRVVEAPRFELGIVWSRIDSGQIAVVRNLTQQVAAMGADRWRGKPTNARECRVMAASRRAGLMDFLSLDMGFCPCAKCEFLPEGVEAYRPAAQSRKGREQNKGLLGRG